MLGPEIAGERAGLPALRRLRGGRRCGQREQQRGSGKFGGSKNRHHVAPDYSLSRRCYRCPVSHARLGFRRHHRTGWGAHHDEALPACRYTARARVCARGARIRRSEAASLLRWREPRTADQCRRVQRRLLSGAHRRVQHHRPEHRQLHPRAADMRQRRGLFSTVDCGVQCGSRRKPLLLSQVSWEKRRSA